MPIQYTNRKGTVFHLCQGVTRPGKPRYYFVLEPKGYPVVLFDFTGWDEMDEVNGAGWAQLTTSSRLEGEFLNEYGRFVAMRDVRKS